MPNRRTFIRSASGAAVFLALRQVLGATGDVGPPGRSPFGPLQPDPGRILDLPQGFSYRIISTAGAPMDDGLRVPAAHDGMAAFDAGNGRVALVCNHELNFNHGKAGPGVPGGKQVPAERAYDAGRGTPLPGGTTTLIYSPSAHHVEHHFLSLAGTERNCAGGPTPWGSWLSCEESVSMPDRNHRKSHGWVFEVPSTARDLVDPQPLTALGRFNHEAVAIDPRTGIAYLTEDQDDGLLYRFIPAEKGRFAAGGRLQALALVDWPGADTRNYPRAQRRMPEGEPASVMWIDLDRVDAPDDDLRLRGYAAGAALFARGEGMCTGPDGIYFACTDGGPIEAGQVFRYRPSPGEGGPAESGDPGSLELFVESTDRRQLENLDNVVMTPWGDLLACEDAKQPCALVGIRPDGGLYTLAENNYSGSELAGACFAPDGRTFFVNLQDPGMTLAISGPWPETG